MIQISQILTLENFQVRIPKMSAFEFLNKRTFFHEGLENSHRSTRVIAWAPKLLQMTFVIIIRSV